jgi:NTP pyrophosphatase (non-canonical NTP hydrolase)
MQLSDLRRSADELFLAMGEYEKDYPEPVARFAILRDKVRALKEVDHPDAPDLESRLADRLRSVGYYVELLDSDADDAAREGFADSIGADLRELDRLLKLRQELTSS